ncbi:hypothetical protein G6F65_017119 [Rhizopus arrhizus]|nr:hypothetical protein G6F65_017119 [Rhizopus arrhizus]
MTAQDLTQVGSDIESLVLSRAVRSHVEHRILLNRNNNSVYRYAFAICCGLILSRHPRQRLLLPRRTGLGRPDHLADRPGLVPEGDEARSRQAAARQAGWHDRHPQPLRHQRRHAQPVAHLVPDHRHEPRRHAHRQHRLVIAGRRGAREEDEIIARQFRQLQRRAVGQRVRVRQAHDKRFGHHIAGVDLVRHRIGVDEAQVLLAAPDGFDLLIGVQLGQHVLHVRQLGPHGVEQRGQAAIQHRPHKADAQPAAQPRVHPLHQRTHLFGLAQQGQRLAVQHLAGIAGGWRN